MNWILQPDERTTNDDAVELKKDGSEVNKVVSSKEE